MSRHSTGTFLEFQPDRISLPGAGTGTLPESITQSLTDIEGGQDFDDSWLSEVGEIAHTALVERGHTPNGEHLAGRNIETELIAGRDALLAFQADLENDAALRVAVIPVIAKVESQLAAREFIRPLRDPEWGADIMELVTRIAPHRIILDERTPEGLFVTEMVAVKLETLRAEYDDYGEICCWIYEES